MIRYAVVGAGWISQEAFLPSVAQSGNSCVTAIVSGDRTKANKLAAFHGIPHVVGYDEYDGLLSRDIVDAVYIALPNSLHADTPSAPHVRESTSWSRNRSPIRSTRQMP